MVATNSLLVSETKEEVVGEGQRMVGHKAAVASVDFSRTGEWLATAGEDKVVKLWDWRSRRVIMDVDSKRGGFYEEGYGVVRKVFWSTFVHNFPFFWIKSDFSIL